MAPGRLLCRAHPQGRKPCGVARDTANLRRDQFRLLFVGAAHDIQSENPSLDCVIAPFCRCVSGSGLHLPGIHKGARNLEARLRIWNIPVYMSAVAQPDEEAPYPVRTAFQRCLASSTDTLLVRQVEAYVAANHASSKGPMVPIIMRAFFNLCRPQIEKAQSPKTAPSQR